MTLLWIFGILLLVGALYLLLVAPAGDIPENADELAGRLYAHRGLHDMERGIPENSMAAFHKAVQAGFGIELDVHPTRDGQLVVFHDAGLQRLCGVDVKVGEVTYEELSAYPLPDGSAIPLFSDVLALVEGRVPLIVEVKHYGNAARNAALALEALADYQGLFCMESFHPLAVSHIRKHAPQVVRGQLASGKRWEKGETSPLTHFSMKHLLMNALGRPHFVAYTFPEDHTPGMWLMKHFFHPLLVAWTLRDPNLLEEAQEEYQMAIFEGFLPREEAGAEDAAL